MTMFIYARSSNGSAMFTSNSDYARTMLRKYFHRPLIKGTIPVKWKSKKWN